jgi:hypothetical protein
MSTIFDTPRNVYAICARCHSLPEYVSYMSTVIDTATYQYDYYMSTYMLSVRNMCTVCARFLSPKICFLYVNSYCHFPQYVYYMSYSCTFQVAVTFCMWMCFPTLQEFIGVPHRTLDWPRTNCKKKSNVYSDAEVELGRQMDALHVVWLRELFRDNNRLQPVATWSNSPHLQHARAACTHARPVPCRARAHNRFVAPHTQTHVRAHNQAR